MEIEADIQNNGLGRDTGMEGLAKTIYCSWPRSNREEFSPKIGETTDFMIRGDNSRSKQ